MKKIGAMLIISLSFLAISCNGLGGGVPGGVSDLIFDIEGAKALAGGSSSSSLSSSRMSINARAAVSTELVKILEDGSVESALSFGSDNGGWTPSIAFMSIGDDDSVYICFDNMYWSWDEENDTQTEVQFLRVYPDNSYDVLWPEDPTSENNWQEQVHTWTWYGQDYEPLVKDASGNIYFMTADWSGSYESNDIWKYSPSTGGKPQRVTPSNGDMSIQNFKVDATGNIYITSDGWNGGSAWMRCYPSGSNSYKTIYYTSQNNIWVRGYTAAPSGSSAIINGENIKGMNGIMRATIPETGDPEIELLYGRSYSSNWINLSKYASNSYQTSTQIISYDNSTSPYTYEWLSDVLAADSSVDQTKLINKVRAYFVGEVSLKDSNMNLDLDADPSLDNSLTTRATLGEWIFYDPEDFLRDSFEGALMKDWLAANNLTTFDIGNINSMIYDSHNNLYGFYDPYWWNSSASDGTKIVKLLDSNGNRDLKIVNIAHGTEVPSKIKFIGDYMYYRYAVMSGGYETGAHKMARLNYTTQVEEEILSDSFFNGKDLEILSYDVADDNSVLYFSALNNYTNEVIFGKIDLNTMVYSDMDYNSTFSKITVF